MNPRVQIWPGWRFWAAWSVAGIVFALALEVGRVTLGSNYHVVVPGKVYRTSQLSGPKLEKLVKSHGIRTVVNLRGFADGCPWLEEECRATHKLNICQEDISFSAARLPPLQELKYLIKVLDRCEYPIVFHCKQGADRTGVISGLYLLLYTNASLDEACRQVSIRYGHVALGRTSHVSKFFIIYRQWLAEKGLAHTPAVCRHWVEHEYCGGKYSCRFDKVELPAKIRADEHWHGCFRVVNTSPEPWHFRVSSSAGVHLMYQLNDGGGKNLTGGRTGLVNRDVGPGEAIDLIIPFPALKKGTYYLFVDLIDEQHGRFQQFGTDLISREITVE